MIQKIEPAAAIRLLDAKKAQAVDVREPDEYAVGHIPGAKLLPLGEVMSRAAEVLPDKDAPWLVYWLLKYNTPFLGCQFSSILSTSYTLLHTTLSAYKRYVPVSAVKED